MFASKDVFLTPPATGGYTIGKSVRLRSSATAYFNRTPGSAGNRQTWTWSAWVKRGTLGATQFLFDATAGIGTRLYFTSGDVLQFDTGGSGVFTTTQVFRDPSAWYHIVFVADTTQATASNRIKLYINGSQVTSFSATSYPAQNTSMDWNNNVAHYLGKNGNASVSYLDGYLTEINNIDGQALTPSSFGSTNALTGVWQPSKYTGTYGTNGFYLNFSSNGSSAALGTDFSGNSNTWTVNNISVTAGSTYDSMVDSPTVSATSSNYCVLNFLSYDSGTYTLSNANLTFAGARTASATSYTRSTLAVSSGKWYWEIIATDVGAGPNIVVGVQDASTTALTAGANLLLNGYGYGADGYKNNNAGQTAGYGATWTNGDVIGIALDLDGGTITFYKNNSSQGVAYSGIAGTYCPVISMSTGGVARTIAGSINFGQRPFTYTPPTGYVALNTYNLPTSTITNGAAYMAASLYTGNAGSITVTNTVNGISFQPDLVWLKARSSAYDHKLVDSVRGSSGGIYYELDSNTTGAESLPGAGVNGLTTTGFTIGGGTNNGYNGNGTTFVGWQWKAGGTSSSNTNGSITSTVSVGATQGFSVVTYTGTGSTATVGHGLGVAPSMIIIKHRNAGGDDWPVYHIGLTSAAYRIYLDTTGAQVNDPTGFMNSTAPTSTVFTVGSNSSVNASAGTFVAYCFAAVKGFSAFGSYTGNGSTDGTFVYLGFRPRFVLYKSATSASVGDWRIHDTSRSTYNAVQLELYPQSSSSEPSSSNAQADILSNGFKLRGVSGNTSWNESGVTYIYAAFAEVPFKYANAR